MPPAQLPISVITDEISPVLDEAIAFAVEEGLTAVDLRGVDGVNFMTLSPEAMRDAARRIRAAGLRVGCLASPLLKWPGPGQPFVLTGDQFGFDPRVRGIEDAYDTAFRAAEVLEAPHVRIFSYLIYAGYALPDLRPMLDHLLAMAEREGRTLVVENEHVCNVATVADLAGILADYRHPRLRGVLDVANAYAFGTPPSAADIARVAPFVDIVHLKDYDPARRRFVALGAGVIPFADLLDPIYRSPSGPRPPLVVETHVPENRMAATRASLAAARVLATRLAGSIA